MQKNKLNERWENVYSVAKNLVNACTLAGVTKKTAEKIFDHVWEENYDEDFLYESKNKKFVEKTERDYETEFDYFNKEFYLDYWLKKSDDWFIELNVPKDFVEVETHFESGDYDDSEAGGLSPGWYGRGYEIDDVIIPEKVVDVSFRVPESDDELTLDKFKEISKLSDEEIDKIIKNAREILAEEIENYVYNNLDDFVYD